MSQPNWPESSSPGSGSSGSTPNSSGSRCPASHTRTFCSPSAACSTSTPAPSQSTWQNKRCSTLIATAYSLVSKQKKVQSLPGPVCSSSQFLSRCSSLFLASTGTKYLNCTPPRSSTFNTQTRGSTSIPALSSSFSASRSWSNRVTGCLRYRSNVVRDSGKSFSIVVPSASHNRTAWANLTAETLVSKRCICCWLVPTAAAKGAGSNPSSVEVPLFCSPSPRQLRSVIRPIATLYTVLCR